MKNIRKYKLKNKNRFLGLIAILMVVIFIAIFSDISYGYNEPVYKTITVNAGDTLWDIARQYKGDGDNRRFVYELKKVNHLESSGLIEGEKIRIPMEQ